MGPNSVATGWPRIMTLLRTIPRSMGGSRPCTTSSTSTSTATCPPLYYVLPRYTSCVETKKTRVLLLFLLVTRHSGRRWRDWRPVLDQILNYRLHVQKVWRSKSRHLSSQNQPKRNRRQISLAERTGSHPAMAGNPSVPQPGLDPIVISFMPTTARPYSQGLANPRGSLPL